MSKGLGNRLTFITAVLAGLAIVPIGVYNLGFPVSEVVKEFLFIVGMLIFLILLAMGTGFLYRYLLSLWQRDDERDE